MRDEGGDEARVAAAKEARHRELEHRLRIEGELSLLQANAQVSEHVPQLRLRRRDGRAHELVQRVEHKLHKGAGATAIGRLAPKSTRHRLVIDVAPQAARERRSRDGRVEVGVDGRK